MLTHILRSMRLRGFGRLAAVAVPVAAAGLIGLSVWTGVQAAAPGGSDKRPGALPGASTESLKDLNLKFLGAESCASCHAKNKTEDFAKNTPAPNYAGNQNFLWNRGDPHAKAFESVNGADGGDKGKKGDAIYAKYKAAGGATEATAKASQKCLTCHALSVPANLKGQKYNVEEGVTCNSCHGPYEKIMDLHQKPGWSAAERTKAGFDPNAFYKNTGGFYDTKDVRARADKCTSCHLAIDSKMVEAGHPQTKFELNTYSASYPDRHWKQEEGYFGVRLWAIGQAVSLRDAMHQLAERANDPAVTDKALKDAYDQAMAHYNVFAPLLTSNTFTVKPEQVKGLTDWVTNLKANMAAKKKPDIAKAATNASSWTIQIAPSMAMMIPTKASTIAMLNTFTGQTDIITTLGAQGSDQQTFAIYSLYSALATSPDKPADSDSVLDIIIKGLYPPEGKTAVDPAAYTKALADVKAKLPK